MDKKRLAIKKKYSIREVESNIQNFVGYLSREHRLPISVVYLYGSYAKDKQREWSDVDICVVSPRFKNTDPLSYLWQKLRQKDIDNLIEPIGFHPDDFKNNESPLIHEIKRTGKKIEFRN